MLRSLIVVLDGSAASLAAARTAFALARVEGAHVEALGIVNAVSIERPVPVPLGGMAAKSASDAAHLARARQRVGDLLETVRREARDTGPASFEANSCEGDPVELVARAAISHDLVVVGRESVFDMEEQPRAVPTVVDRLVRREPRPLLVVPSTSRCGAVDDATSPALVAFDGSAAASRALHMFALLGLANGRAVHVLTLDNRSSKAAQATAEAACTLLIRHGVERTQAVGLGDAEAGTPSETILGMARSLEAGLIVMGAYGHSGIREWFGSCTGAVLAACPTVLFLHH